MNRNKIVSGFMTIALTMSSIAAGQQRPTDSAPHPTPGSSASASGVIAISPLKKGQPAPFSGVLFTPRAAASVATEISTFRERSRIEITAAVASAEAKKDFKYDEAAAACKTDKNVLRTAVETERNRSILLEKEFKKLKDEMPSKNLWLGIGVLGGATLTLLTVFAVSRATK